MFAAPDLNTLKIGSIVAKIHMDLRTLCTTLARRECHITMVTSPVAE
jgi:hypothetical protein